MAKKKYSASEIERTSKSDAEIERAREAEEIKKAHKESLIRESLRLVREAHNLTQPQFAQMVDWDPQRYARMERGETKIDAEALKRISDTLKIDIRALYDYEGFNKLIEKGAIVNEPETAYKKRGKKKEQKTVSLMLNISTDDSEFINAITELLNKQALTLNS